MIIIDIHQHLKIDIDLHSADLERLKYTRYQLAKVYMVFFNDWLTVVLHEKISPVVGK